MTSVAIPYGGDQVYPYLPYVGGALTAGENLVLGDVCYIKAADGKAWKAQNDGTEAEAHAQMICTSSAILANASGLFATSGLVSGLSGGTAGSIVYLSGTPGGKTTTAPTYGTNTYTKVIGRWWSTTILLFSADPGIMPQFNN